MMDVPEIKGERVTLRGIESGDLEFVRTLRNEPKNSYQFLSQEYITTEDTEEWFRSYHTSKTDMTFIILAEDGKTMGTVALYHIDPGIGQAELGRMLLDESARRSGYAKEATLLLVNYGFKELSLNWIFLDVFSDNDAAIRLYESVGFSYQGKVGNEGSRGIIRMGLQS